MNGSTNKVGPARRRDGFGGRVNRVAIALMSIAIVGPSLAAPVHAGPDNHDAILAYERDATKAKTRVLYVEFGEERIKTTEYDLLYDTGNGECSFLGREGSYRVVDEEGNTFSEGGCRCCTRINQEGQKWVPRSRHWEPHGRYVRFIKDPDPGYPSMIEEDFWCGYRTADPHEGLQRSKADSCDIPIVPWPDPAE